MDTHESRMHVNREPHGPDPANERRPTLRDLLRRPLRRWSRRYVIAAVFFVAHVLGAISSLDALMSTRTSQGTVAWMISLNTMPYVAVPAYWVFGRTKFQGYVIGRREDDNELYHELRDKIDHLRAQAVTVPDGHDVNGIEAIERLAKMPLVGGNEVELLVDGEATFDSLFAGIDAAERYLLVQFYIVRDDELGRELSRRLRARAAAGVEVYFLYDEIGSYRLPSRYLSELEEAGVNVRRFHSTRGWGNRFQLNFRNHRKIVVADGEHGWLGGFNVGDEYLGNTDRGPWRDTHLRLSGSATLVLQLSFVEDWHWATGDAIRLDWDAHAHAQSEAEVPVLVIPTGPADRFETASLMMQHAIHAARERIWISSPYFVPDEGVLAALKLAALRGVDVRVLIAERPDSLLAYLAAYAFIGPLIEAEVGIHRYQEGFLHGKAVLVDDVASAVGTVNLDNRSFRLNFEITAWMFDRKVAEEVEAMFEDDFQRSRLMELADVEERPWWFRAASRAAYLTAPVL